MLHKLSADHVRNYDLIAFEDLVPSNMVKDHKLVKAIQDASWSEFRRQLVYKGTGKWWSRLILPLRSAMLVLRCSVVWGKGSFCAKVDLPGMRCCPQQGH